MPAKRGRKVGSWTKWPPERFKQAIDLIKAGYNYTEAAEAVGAKRHELTARLIQTNQYIQIRKMRPPVWQTINTAPKNQWILVYQPNISHGGHCFVAQQTNDGVFWYDKSTNVLEIEPDEDATTIYHTCVPTHWMQLPERPQ